MKTLLIIPILTFFFINVNSQHDNIILEKPDLKFKKTSKFYKKEIIFVLGQNCPDYNLYNKTIDRHKGWVKNIEAKKENELVCKDYKKHLYFYGQINWYQHWERYNLPIEKLDNGFALGSEKFTKGTHAIVLINSSKDRFAFIGNSLSSLLGDRGRWGAYDYFILDNTKRVQWGNLSNNSFDSLKHINGIKERFNILDKKIEQDYLTIHYPNRLTNNEDYFTSINEIKTNLDKIIKLLELKSPNYVIEGYIYKDKFQKVQLCYHEGYGVAYPAWKEINVIYNETGNNDVIIHESIHILFNNEINNDNKSTLLDEGIVGYAMSLLDSVKIKKNPESVKLCFKDPIDKWFDERIDSGREIPPNKLYPISGAWVSYLIEKFGLEKFKNLYSLPKSELKNGYKQIYHKSITELTNDFKDYINNIE